MFLLAIVNTCRFAPIFLTFLFPLIFVFFLFLLDHLIHFCYVFSSRLFFLLLFLTFLIFLFLFFCYSLVSFFLRISFSLASVLTFTSTSRSIYVFPIFFGFFFSFYFSNSWFPSVHTAFLEQIMSCTNTTTEMRVVQPCSAFRLVPHPPTRIIIGESRRKYRSSGDRR